MLASNLSTSIALFLIAAVTALVGAFLLWVGR